jgi:2-polyprenyl-3-methyl-5-hydroxy-6-metoxy-1,4-benzoquinol methylase
LGPIVQRNYRKKSSKDTRVKNWRKKKAMVSRETLPSIDDQRSFWNWHWQHWQERKVLNDWTERRAQEILGLIRGLSLARPRILDFGCGLGWFTERLADFGEAHGIDLSEESIAAARARRPDITYLAGDLYKAPLPKCQFDVVVSQEVIAHVEDQPKYVDLAGEVLKPGGYFIITTGNKFVMDRLGDVGWSVQPPQHIRVELSRRDLKKLLAPRFKVLKGLTIIPHGSRGILRLVNSYKLNAAARWVIPQEKIDGLKEKAGLGSQMVFLAQKKP